jgi:1,4-dihydroxy-2-naphthoyl-CoA hydrolase
MENMSRTPEVTLSPAQRVDDGRVGHATPAVQGPSRDAQPIRAVIWHGSPGLDQANEISAGSAIGHLGIEFTELGPNHLIGRMPVDRRTRQPFGILHGGASLLLAETLVSCAATFVVAPGKVCVGMEINANHLRPVNSGWVTGTARPISLGRRSQVWEVRIVDDNDKLVCISRCTMAVIEAP